MLLYLSSKENINMIDFLHDEHGMIIKKLSGTFSLKQFVLRDMRSLEHFNNVLIDLKALKDTEDEMMEAVIGFRKMFSSRMIVYIEAIKEQEKLILQLIEAGIYNIVSSAEMELLKVETTNNVDSLDSEIGCETYEEKKMLYDCEQSINMEDGCKCTRVNLENNEKTQITSNTLEQVNFDSLYATITNENLLSGTLCHDGVP